MKNYKNYDEIRADLDKGVEIFWQNKGYKVFYEELVGEEETKKRQRKMKAVKGDKMIVCRFTANYFGGVLGEGEIQYCYSEGE